MDARPVATEQRVSDRRLLRVSGSLWFPGSAPIAVRTQDASPGGLGVVHDAPVPKVGSHGRVRLDVLAGSTATVFEAAVEVRYTMLAGGALRSGLQFVSLQPRHAALLAAVLEGRPPIMESRRG